MSPRKQFEHRIERLEHEREYSRPGWRVALREARIPSTVPSYPLRLSLKTWLMYPLLGSRAIPPNEA